MLLDDQFDPETHAEATEQRGVLQRTRPAGGSGEGFMRDVIAQPSAVSPPAIEVARECVDTRAAGVGVAANRQAMQPLPSLDGADGTAEMRRDLLP
jgi:hypothetical protein